jgi:hypothetical protein
MSKRKFPSVARQHGKPDSAFGNDMQVGAGVSAGKDNLSRIERRLAKLLRDGLSARPIEPAEKRGSGQKLNDVGP